MTRDIRATRRQIESQKTKRICKIVLTLVQTSRTPNKSIRALMLLVRAIMTSGDEGVDRPYDSSMAIGVYPGKRRRGICIRARHPRDERSITPRSPNRTEENRTSGQSPRESAFFPPRRTPCFEKSREEKRSEARHSRNAMTRSPDRPSEIDVSLIYTPTMRSQNPSYSTITVHHEKKGIQASLGFARRQSCAIRLDASHRTPHASACFSVAMSDMRVYRYITRFHARSEQIPLSSAIIAKF